MFAPGPDPTVTKIGVGLRPNGLAYDAKRRLVLAANVGDPAVPRSYTLSMVDLDAGKMRSSIEVPGRTRWTVFDPEAEVFYVNIMQPSQIVVVDARTPDRVARTMPVPADAVPLQCPRCGSARLVARPDIVAVFVDDRVGKAGAEVEDREHGDLTRE